MDRSEKQEEVIKQYIRSSPKKATLVLSTSFGKSKLTIDLVTAIQPKRIVILVNSTNLRDITWAKEFDKWGEGEFFQMRVRIYTYQAVHNWKHNKILPDDYVVLDEVDFIAGTEEYSKIMDKYLLNNTVLGLTGYIDKKKLWWFKQYLPVAFEYSGNQATDEKMLNDVEFIFVKYEVSMVKDRLVEYKKDGFDRKFFTSENNQLDFAHTALKHAEANLLDVETNINLSGNARREAINFANSNVQFKKTALMTALYSLQESSRLAIDYIAKYTKQGFKVVTFSERTEQADRINKNTYHGKNTERVNNNHLVKFMKGDSLVLATCSKINRGANIPNLKVGIFESYNSSGTQFTQRIGRLKRLEPDDTAIAVILLPHYYSYDKITKEYTLKESRMVVWARKMMKDMKINKYKIVNLLNNEIEK
jgi:superfamily II DNA or RNA helicase